MPAGRKLKVLYLLFLLACLTACGDSSSTGDKDEATSGVNIEGEDESELEQSEPLYLGSGVFSASRTGDLDVMESQRVIRVLTVYGVGRYYLDGPREKGLVYEMFKRFEDFLNERLNRGHMRVHVVIIPVARSQLMPALLQGRGDIISAGLTITGERQKLVDFSIPTSKPVSEILVTGPSAADLASVDALSGQTLYLRQSSSYRESVEKLNERFLKEGRAKVTIEPLSELLEDDDLIEMVNTGLLPWAIVDDYKTQLWDGVFEDLRVREDIVFRSEARLGYAFRKDSPLLESAINDFLKKNRQGTLMGNILVNRYLRDFDWATNALAQNDYQRFENLADYFKNYGEQYGFDYLIVAAQGYQESRLQQSVRSSAGAIGVMQLLPSTAADPKVGIPNIELVEPNIHAGIKYLSYLRGRYFSEPDIDQLNQTLLSLAAYNAGPARLISLRAQAEQMGYDPNKWFDNVEVVAAREVGRETVQYVANIYKYYLSYRLTAQQQLRRKQARLKAGIKQASTVRIKADLL